MKLNWNAFKIALAFVVIAGVIFWAVDSVRSRSYSETNLSFDTADGIISVTNLSDDPVAAQLTSSGFRIFQVSSTTEGVSGSSTREGTGSTRTNLFGFELPPGTSEFTISGGTDIRFVADTDTELQATVNPLSDETRRNTLLAAVVGVFGALFYASNVTGHQWIKSLRHRVLPSHQATSVQATQPNPAVNQGNQGYSPRSYGDNRAEF
jgi:preprotein translocase subunit SecE